MSSVLRVLSAREAERLTDQIKFTIESIDNGLFKLRNLLEEAQNSNVWQMLGFSSWTAYLASLFEGRPMRLPREQRQELVAYLSGEGMSSRAIAPIAGVTPMQVSRDVKASAGVTNVTPAPDLEEPPTQYEAEVTAPVQEAPQEVDADPVTGEVIEEEPVTPRVVVGLDGKNYPAPAQQVRRGSILDDARNTGYTLRKAVERVERLIADDRFTKNKVEILAALQPHLDFAKEVLEDLHTNPEEN